MQRLAATFSASLFLLLTIGAPVTQAGSWAGTRVDVGGPRTEITVTFGPDTSTGPGEPAIPTVLVTGTIDGHTINTSGWAVPGADGRLRLAPADDPSGTLMLCGEHYCYLVYWHLDPAEFGDGDPDDDFCGFTDDISSGLPRPDGKRVNYH